MCISIIKVRRPWKEESVHTNPHQFGTVLFLLGPRAARYSDVIMGEMTYQITSLTIVYSPVYPGLNQRKHQSSGSLAFVRRVHWWPVTQKMFSFDDVTMRPMQTKSVSPSLQRKSGTTCTVTWHPKSSVNMTSSEQEVNVHHRTSSLVEYQWNQQFWANLYLWSN